MQIPSEKTIKMLFSTEEELFASIIDARLMQENFDAESVFFDFKFKSAYRFLF